MPNDFAITEFVGSTINTEPLQSGVRSDDLQAGQTFPIVTHLHLRHAISLTMYHHFASTVFFGFSAFSALSCCGWEAFAPFFISSSIHSSAPRYGCLHVIPTFMAAVFPSDTAVILARSVVPIFIVLPLWFASIRPDLTSLFR